jgi:RimJ/RimL family protein N-acetyltransferase
MEKINQSDYGKIKDFIQYKNINVPTFTYSVLDGYIKGEVYADSSLPKTILIETYNGVYFVGGSENNEEFNQHLINLYRQRKSQNVRFTLFSSGEKWDSLIKDQLRNEVKQLHRYSYNFVGGKELSSVHELPRDYCIRRITPELIDKSLEFNRKYYEEYWGSVQNFIDRGFGYCILHNEKIVSECTSIFCSSKYTEIDIATSDSYRGQGLATVLAKIFIKNSLENNLIPGWDCDVSNNSSIRLALNLGFTNPNEYSIFV